MNTLLNSAWSAVVDEPSDKLVLVYLADRANRSGKAWPHLPTIAKHTGLTERTIITSIKRLETRGHITVSRRQGCSNSYVVHAGTNETTSPVKPLHVRGETTSPLPVKPFHVQPNHQVNHQGTGRSLPPLRRREAWQLLRDEETLTKRINCERESTKPDKELIESLKAERTLLRSELKKPATRPSCEVKT